MPRAGWARSRIERRLNAAYAGGLLSDETFAARIEDALRAWLVDPAELVGDLTFRKARRSGLQLGSRVRAWLARLIDAPVPETLSQVVLALEWSGTQGELLIGRDYSCDLVLEHPTVSRQHARAFFRDGKWIVQDLGSTNGTVVNGVSVGRCELRPGDDLLLGEQYLRID